MNKPYAAWLIGINLVLLLALYSPLLSRSPYDGYIILSLLALNVAQIAVNLVIALIVSIVPPWRKYAGVWWLTSGLLLLASFPVCLGFSFLNSALRAS